MLDGGDWVDRHPRRCNLYSSRLINKEVFRRLSTRKHLTPEQVQDCVWPDLLSIQGFSIAELREKMSMGIFRINDAYWRELNDQPIAHYEATFVFYATVSHLDCLYYLIWPLGSESIYVLPCEGARLFYYKKFNGPIEVDLGGNWKPLHVHGRPFTERFYFSRTYKVNYLLGIFEKRPLSVEAVNDAVHYKGYYDDASETCVLDEKIAYPPFWLVKHKDEVKPLTGAEIPHYTSMISTPGACIAGHVEE